MLNRITAASLLTLCVVWNPSIAQVQSAADTPESQVESVAEAVDDRILVTAARLDRDLLLSPAAVSLIDEDALQTARQGLQLDESLNRVPGLFFQNRYNFAQNLRVSVRGFGARSPFGVRGVRLLVDGFPQTLPDGQAQVDGTDLESVIAAEVLRGPSSALYGNASGGVISLRTQDGRGLDPEAQARASWGSYGFQRLGLRAGGQFDEWNAYISAWDLRYDGFREQSRTETRLLNAHLGREFGAGRHLGVVLTAADQPIGQDPAALNRAQLAVNRRAAGGQAVQVNSRQEVSQFRLGLRYEDTSSLPGELKAYAFVAQRDFKQQLPSTFFPSLIEFDRDFFGGGLQYTDRFNFAGPDTRYTLGVDLARQRDDRRRFRVTPAAEPAAQTQDELQRADNGGIFGQLDIGLSEQWRAVLGVRYDRITLDIDDFFGDRVGSGRRNFDEFSWTAGLNYLITPARQLYFNAGTAFETPSFTEIKDAAGGVGFSRDLEPQRARNLEFGLRDETLAKLDLSVAVFRVETRDEIIIIAAEDGLNIFDNAGRTRRDGLELGAEYRWSDRLSFSAAYTWSHFRFSEFRDASAVFDGNRLPGLPQHALFAEAAWRSGGGWFVIADTLVVSSVFADNGNAERVAGYALLNARAGRSFSAGGLQWEAFAALNNLSDREYFSNIRINAANGAFFEAAPERNVFVGLRVGL
ncbi:MAG: TonB-dependent receptor family protein [Wenzhouxiangella sp.]